MKTPSILSKYFEDIEAFGGTGICYITYRRSPAKGLKQEQISQLWFRVEIVVPFSHCGQDSVALGCGNHEMKTAFQVNSLDDLAYPLQQGRMAAFKAAISSLVEDLRMKMLGAKPTTSHREQERKIKSVLKKIGAAGLA